MRRGFRAKKTKVFAIMFFGLAFIALFSFIVMMLWNAILPGVIHVSPINFWQALGILLLSKILFGGFGGGGWKHRKHQWREKMQEKLQHMTPEERIKFQQEWRDRCRFGRRRFTEHQQQQTPNQGEAGTE